MVNDRTHAPEPSGTHIRLRYTRQIVVGKRNHTVEVDITVPPGASDETRERLFREAEESVEQLARYMERRVEQAQHGQLPQPAQVTQPVPRPPGAPAAASKPAAAPVPAPARDKAAPPTPHPEPREVAAPPTRPNLGATMPVAPGNISGSMNRVQFIQGVRELGLDIRKAMELLNVKSLEGLNYREEFDSLQQIVMREPPPAPPAPASQPARDTGPAKPARPEAGAEPSLAPPMARPSSQPPVEEEPRVPAGVREIRGGVDGVLRDAHASYGFDEEDDEDFAPGDDEDYLSDLTEQEREHAQEIVATLREVRGSASPNEKRFQALRNVVNDQVSDERLEEVIAGIWGAASLRKLKDEQLEALISWAKRSDDFIADVDMVLALLQEEAYARSDR